MNKILFIILFATIIKAQTPNQVSVLPGDYLNKTITFQQAKIQPTFSELDGYYVIEISVNENMEKSNWDFGLLDKITGVIDKKMVKKFVNSGVMKLQEYHGSIIGKVIKRKNALNVGSDYLFIIKEATINVNGYNIEIK